MTKINEIMTLRNTKTVLFASLIAVMILSFSMTDNAFAETKETSQDNEFEIKSEFKNKFEAKEYGKDLTDEIEKQYDKVKEAAKRHDDKLAEKSEKLEELKQNGIALINEYYPDTTPLGVTEDEYFEMVDTNNPNVSNIRYDYASAPIVSVITQTGSLVAKIGYDHPCPLVPILPCGTDVGSSRTVKTSDSGKSFVGRTQENNNWIRVWQHFTMYSAGTYQGVTAWVVDGDGSDQRWTQEKPWWANTVKMHGNMYGSNSCSCNPVSDGTVINAIIDLRSFY